MTALMSETLMQKEHIIKALEDQLNDETKRRKNISKDYKTQVKEFELDQKALENLKKQSENLERKKQRKEAEELKNNDLDMVPTREKKKAEPPKKYKLQDHPIFFKNSKIESRIPKQSQTTQSKKQLPKQTPKKSQTQSIQKLEPVVSPVAV